VIMWIIIRTSQEPTISIFKADYKVLQATSPQSELSTHKNIKLHIEA